MKDKIVWSNEHFSKEFLLGNLKRKREYGNLYVVEGENCFILMSKTESPPFPVAIKVKNSNTAFVREYNPVRNFISSIQIAPSVQDPSFSLIETNFNIFESKNITKIKFIDKFQVNIRKDTNTLVPIFIVLIDIEGEKLLFDLVSSTEKTYASIEEYKERYNLDNYKEEYNRRGIYQRSIYSVDSNVNSVKEAIESLIPEEPVTCIYDNVFFIPSNINPEQEDQEKIEILKNIPNRFQFGLSEEFENIGWHITRVNNDLEKFNERYPEDVCEKLKRYAEAWIRYSGVKNKNEDESTLLLGLVVSSNKNVEGGLIIDDYENVYLKGIVYSYRKDSMGGSKIKLAYIEDTGYKPPFKIKTFKDWHKVVSIKKIL